MHADEVCHDEPMRRHGGGPHNLRDKLGDIYNNKTLRFPKNVYFCYKHSIDSYLSKTKEEANYENDLCL